MPELIRLGFYKSWICLGNTHPSSLSLPLFSYPNTSSTSSRSSKQGQIEIHMAGGLLGMFGRREKRGTARKRQEAGEVQAGADGNRNAERCAEPKSSHPDIPEISFYFYFYLLSSQRIERSRKRCRLWLDRARPEREIGGRRRRFRRRAVRRARLRLCPRGPSFLPFLRLRLRRPSALTVAAVKVEDEALSQGKVTAGAAPTTTQLITTTSRSPWTWTWTCVLEQTSAHDEP